MSPYGIETEYNGQVFRSMLEVRWAIFFDSLGIDFDYEETWFDFGDGDRYCPDFWLPQVGMWAEVKPKWFNERELRVAYKLAQETGYPCLKLVGQPDCTRYWAIMPDGSECDYVLVPHFRENRFIQQPWHHFKFDFAYEDAVEAAQTATFEQEDNMATYEQIQAYVFAKYGYVPQSCWIAHAKELSGLPVRRAPNRKGDEREKPCPADNVNDIRDAFRHFNMIQTLDRFTQDELRHVLDPQEACGSDFPGETSRVLKEKELKAHGEFRTRRLVLEKWNGQRFQNCDTLAI